MLTSAGALQGLKIMLYKGKQNPVRAGSRIAVLLSFGRKFSTPRCSGAVGNGRSDIGTLISVG